MAELNKNLIKDNYDYIIYYTEHPFPNCSYYFEIRNIADSGVVNVNSKSNKIRQFGKKDRLVMYERDQPFTVQDLEKMGKNFIDIVKRGPKGWKFVFGMMSTLLSGSIKCKANDLPTPKASIVKINENNRQIGNESQCDSGSQQAKKEIKQDLHTDLSQRPRRIITFKTSDQLLKENRLMQLEAHRGEKLNEGSKQQVIGSFHDSAKDDLTLKDLVTGIRGGEISPLELIIKILYILSLGRVHQTQGFKPNPNPNPMNHHHFSQGHMQPAPRTAPKLLENPIDRNNPRFSVCKASQHPSMDEMSDSLCPEHSEYQSKYYPESEPKRFDTHECSAKKFKELANDPRANYDKYDRASVDEARAIVQAELDSQVIEPTRPDMETARRVDLDFKVQGPAPYTHVDVKNPVGSDILQKQGQTRTVEEMAYEIGQKIAKQKQTFVGEEGGPASPENVGHMVDLCYVQAHEKPLVKRTILQGARDTAGSDAGILFINDR